MNLVRAFQNSLLLPSQNALFRLNRMGMGLTLAYLFILLFLITLPGAIRYTVTPHPDLGQSIPPTLIILQYIVFDYLLFIFVGLCVISVLAFLISGVSAISKRKLSYRHLWKVSAFASTVPFLLYGVSICFDLKTSIIPIVLFLLTVAILTRIIFIFPKRS